MDKCAAVQIQEKQLQMPSQMQMEKKCAFHVACSED